VKKAGVLVLAISAIFSTAASADIVTVIYTGTAQIVDLSGLFGIPGSNVSDNFTATYVFDTNFPGAGQFNNGVQFETFGGTAYPLPNPLVSASLTVDGHTFTSTGSVNSELATTSRSAGTFTAFTFITDLNNGISNTISTNDPNAPVLD
jgi:hypothetical protein